MCRGGAEKKEKDHRKLKLSMVFWSECRDSNSRPLEPHSSAIPNFATPGYSVLLQADFSEKIGAGILPTPIGPSVEIRTRGLLNPIQARYQTSPHPDILFLLRSRCQLAYINTSVFEMQVFFSIFLKKFEKSFLRFLKILIDKESVVW